MRNKTVLLAIGMSLVLAACGTQSADIGTDNSTIVTEDARQSEDISVDEDTAFTSNTSNIAMASTLESNNTTVSASAETTIVDTDVAKAGITTSNTSGGLMSMFPIIDYPEYGTGRGPGANFRSDFDYINLDFDGSRRHPLGEANWWELTTWTASNGVVLKVVPSEGITNNLTVIDDGRGLDLIPGSDYQMAVSEAMGTYEYWGDTDNSNMYYQFTVIPEIQIPASTYKRTDFDINDSKLLEYKASWEEVMNNDGGGTQNWLIIEKDRVTARNLNCPNVWVVRYDEKMAAWRITMNPSFLYAYQKTWDGLKNILKYVNPEGEKIYNLIYTNCYIENTNVITYYDEWYDYGNNQVMLQYDEIFSGLIYYFR